MKKKIPYLATLLLLLPGIINAQSKKFIRHCPDTNRVKPIDEVKLKNIIQESRADVTYLLIFTNNCSGTPYALQRVKYLHDLFGDRLNLLVCGSVKERKIRKMLGHLDKYSVPVKTAYVIDGTKYREKLLDARYKGFLFRNAICEPCKKDLIGVPYSMIFDRNGNVIEGGYIQTRKLEGLIAERIPKLQ